MNYDLIELAKRCPNLAITVRLADLVEANRGLIEETKRELAQSLEASKPETYLTREKVMEMLERYGIRMKDRMDETFDFITFSNQSYRKQM